MEDVKEMLNEQERELERIRQKRNRKPNTEGLRRLLNILFLVAAAVGLVLYFAKPEMRQTALIVIAVGMVLKIAEFFVRFLL
ncbi:MAG: hypothetical protein IJ197_05195 [Bacteroidaceae bacterium]|nr:hypothetical protein [Bacteroidaceae bacterium]